MKDQPDNQAKPQDPKAIPAEGNNIASAFDRAHADMPPASEQPPVEKTFVSPPDAHTKEKPE